MLEARDGAGINSSDLLVGRSGTALIFDGKLHPHLGNDLAVRHLRSPPAQAARMYRQPRGHPSEEDF